MIPMRNITCVPAYYFWISGSVSNDNKITKGKREHRRSVSRSTSKEHQCQPHPWASLRLLRKPVGTWDTSPSLLYFHVDSTPKIDCASKWLEWKGTQFRNRDCYFSHHSIEWFPWGTIRVSANYYLWISLNMMWSVSEGQQKGKREHRGSVSRGTRRQHQFQLHPLV